MNVRRIIAHSTAAGALLTAGGLGLLASPAEAAVYHMTTTASVNLRSAPSTSASVVGSVPAGGTVDIRCYVVGQSLTDSRGVVSAVWDRTSTGAYVWDGLVQTGSTNPVVPSCTGGSGPAAAASAASALVSGYNGKYVDVDGYYGAQCWDLAARFTLNNGLGAIATGDGSAAGIYNLYATNGNANNYYRYANSPSAYPRAGDILVWGKTSSRPWGHVAVVTSASAANDSVTVLEQNAPTGSPAHLTTYTSWTGISGWLRPKKWA